MYLFSLKNLASGVQALNDTIHWSDIKIHERERNIVIPKINQDPYILVWIWVSTWDKNILNNIKAHENSKTYGYANRVIYPRVLKVYKMFFMPIHDLFVLFAYENVP